MTAQNNQMSNHHRICKSIGGTNHFSNLTRIKQAPHRAIHTLFENKAPHEQVITLLNINGEAITKEFRERVIEIISGQDLEKIYNREAVDFEKLEYYLKYK